MKQHSNAAGDQAAQIPHRLHNHPSQPIELDEWFSETEAAAAVKKCKRTLKAWRKKGIGPPYAFFGRTIRYRKSALVEHFRAIEINPVRARKSARR